MSANGTGAGRKGPGEFITNAVGKGVIVKLGSGVDYRGTLKCLDGFLNVVLEA